jgi:YtkA-like
MRLGNLLVLAPLVGLAACGTSSSGDDYEPIDCSTVTDVDTFVVGLEHQGVGGTLDFQLMSVDPAPPQRGDNTWIVQINAMASGVVGNPVDGATLGVSPYMPAHQHGSPITATVTPTATSGQYMLSPVNLWMPGVWETTISAQSPAGTDRAVYKFCIP